MLGGEGNDYRGEGGAGGNAERVGSRGPEGAGGGLAEDEAMNSR